MIKSGLVSISFRELSADEVIKATAAAGLKGIEWGSDVHVPAGDIETAEKVGKLTREAGLEVFAYGSYYRAGENEDPAKDFMPYLQSAVALGAPSIRVWAGAKWSWRADEAYVAKVFKDTQIICDMAAEHGIKICYEYHGWTLTDNRFSALDTLDNIKRDNMYLYWQPNFTLTKEENILALKMVRAKMNDVHVFNWDECGARYPLAEAKELWKEFVDIIKSDDKDHNLMLEFIPGNTLEQLNADAAILNELIG